jgi:hypothetical protein
VKVFGPIIAQTLMQIKDCACINQSPSPVLPEEIDSYLARMKIAEGPSRVHQS